MHLGDRLLHKFNKLSWKRNASQRCHYHIDYKNNENNSTESYQSLHSFIHVILLVLKSTAMGTKHSILRSECLVTPAAEINVIAFHHFNIDVAMAWIWLTPTAKDFSFQRIQIN